MADIRTAFLSSTGADLHEYREVVYRSISALDGWKCIRMEDFGARDTDVDSFCRLKARTCDLFIGIIGHRFGASPPGLKESFTQREFAAAVEAARPRLLFVAPANFPIPANILEPAWKVKAQAKFRAALSPQRLPAPAFESPDHLASQVVTAIRNWELENPPPATRRNLRRANATLAAQDSPDRKPYLESLHAETRTIDIRGLQVSRQRAHQFEIDKLYTPLSTLRASFNDQPASQARAAKGGGPLPANADDRQLAVERPAPLQQALSHQRLVIVGDPGSGKTTFLHRISFAVCQTLLGRDPGAAQAFLGFPSVPFPMLVRTGRLVQFIRDRKGKDGNEGPEKLAAYPTETDSPEWIPLYLEDAARPRGWQLSRDFFRRQLREGGLLMVDGLDEAPDRPTRKQAARLLAEVGRTYKKARIVVTSRPPAYGGEAVIAGFETAQVSPLDPSAITYFLTKWCQSIYEDPHASAAHQSELERDLRSRPEIRRMAAVPVMLTALAVLHWNDKRLPDQRAELYDSIIMWLARSREEKPGRLPAERCRNVMKQLAWAMHTHRSGKQVELSPSAAAQAIAPQFREASDDDARLEAADLFLSTEEVDSGILVSRGDKLRFWHLTFQEYLAAQVLAVRPNERAQLLISQRRAFARDWRETVLLLCGVLYKQEVLQLDEFVVALLNTLVAEPSLQRQAECVGLLGAIIKDLRIWAYQPADRRYATHLRAVEAIFDKRQAASIDFQVRLEAAEALGSAGDPRLQRDNWVPLDGREFWMGAQKEDKRKPNYDKDASPYEAPVHRVQVRPFAMARYPVTVSEFRSFVDAGGYEENEFWQNGGWGLYSAPEDWEDQAQHLNRPVTGVSWFEAKAYCAWAGCRLPTEAEWEYAARRGGERYPWGAQPPDAARANYRESGPGLPTPVGLHPAGATPDGLEDMAGNVLEWVEDWFEKEFYQSRPILDIHPKGPDEGEERVLRGGSWFNYPRYLRVSYRLRDLPSYRYDYIGFRCTREAVP